MVQLKQSSPAVTDSALRLPSDLPALPDDVVARFPTLGRWQQDADQFWRQAQNALQDFSRAILDVTEIAGILTVDPNNASVYIRRSKGGGKWADPDTGFFVDRNSFFSLGSALTWNPQTATLEITGTINADSGTIGGFEIGTDYIRDVANSMGLSSAVSGGDDVRFWAGDSFANRATAPFRVTESGALVATNATITGTITATSGTIGGFSIGADYIRDSANSMGLASTVTGGDDVRFWAGDTFANRASAPFRVTEGGAIAAISGTIAGFTLSSTTLTSGANASYVSISSLGTAGFQVGTGTATRVFLQSDGGSGEAGVFLADSSANTIGNVVILTADGSTRLSLGGGSGAATQGVRLIGVTSKIEFGTIGAGDTNLYRSGANTLKTDDDFLVGSAITLATAGTVALTGAITWSGDTNLYRNAANVLKTDDTFAVGANISLTPATGAIVGSTLAGADGGITGINANNISSGTLNNSRLPSTINVADYVCTNSFTASVGATMQFGTHSALGAEVLSGFITINDSGGTSRKMAVIS